MKCERCLIKDNIDEPSNNKNISNSVGHINDKHHVPMRAKASLCFKIAYTPCAFKLFNTFQELNNPKRMYNLDETLHETYNMQLWSCSFFSTKWSAYSVCFCFFAKDESFYFLSKNTRYIR